MCIIQIMKTPFIQNLLATLIGAGFGAFLGFRFAQRLERKAANRVSSERTRIRRKIIQQMLLEQLVEAEGLLELLPDKRLFTYVAHIDTSTIDSIALDFSELFYPDSDQSVDTDATVIFESLRGQLKVLQWLVDTHKQILIWSDYGIINIDGYILQPHLQAMKTSAKTVIELINKLRPFLRSPSIPEAP